jgi:Holliday junction resolvasome RuvABC DNA-binding subunit
MAKLSPFDLANIINEKKVVVDVDEVGYEPYIINRVFSNTRDSVLFANEMNRYWSLSKQQQFDFYYHGLSKKKRFGKWHKNQDDVEALEIIQEYFGYSRHKAKEVLETLRPHLDDISKEMDKGGRNVAKGRTA